MHSFKSYQKYLCAGVIASLAACQSQDGNNTAPPTGPTAEQIGTYVDSAVQGLSYETPSRNGVTSSTGAFLAGSVRCAGTSVAASTSGVTLVGWMLFQGLSPALFCAV